MAKLWQKDYSIDSLMESFTVKNDYILDQELVIADCFASLSHARGLHKIGILNDDEISKLKEGLSEIIKLRQVGKFEISFHDEDCHTAIEGYLVKKYNEVGKKIHTGRSRNDQVQTALRLYMRESLLILTASVLDLIKALKDLAKENENVPMPGRTHTQIAMPSSVGLWAMSFCEELIDTVNYMLSFYPIADQSPLGSAASYGVPLPLDREYTAHIMGFSKVQNNVLYANNSRGRFEAMYLDLCSYIALTISKLAQDLILFSLPEFGYFSLPVELTTGSSIMPQKKNPDGLELARSRTSAIMAGSEMVKNIIKSLPSGYNRDFQDTKEPFINGFRTTDNLIRIIEKTVLKLSVHEEKLLAACTDELYATDVVLEKVMKGGNFRDSYKDVGLNLKNVRKSDPYEALKERTSIGTSGNLNIGYAENEIRNIERGMNERMESLQEIYDRSFEGLSSLIP